MQIGQKSAIGRRHPFLPVSPHSPASTAVHQLAQRLNRVFETHALQTSAMSGTYFPRIHPAECHTLIGRVEFTEYSDPTNCRRNSDRPEKIGP